MLVVSCIFRKFWSEFLLEWLCENKSSWQSSRVVKVPHRVKSKLWCWSLKFLQLNSSEFSLSVSSTSAQKVSICAETEKILSNGKYEKSICYVKSKKTQSEAVNFCRSNGMRFYQTSSSTAALSEALKFVKIALKGNANAAVLINRKANTCQVINGTGAVKTVSCTASREFLCEFKASGLLFCRYKLEVLIFEYFQNRRKPSAGSWKWRLRRQQLRQNHGWN